MLTWLFSQGLTLAYTGGNPLAWIENKPLNDEFELTPYFFDIRTKFSTLNGIKDHPTRSSETIVLKLL
jgi:hypothetical protein